MFGINGIEFFMVVAFALLLFGPDKLPGIAKTIGRFVGEFKRTQEVMESQIRAEMYRSNMGATAEKVERLASDDADEDESDDETEEDSDAEAEEDSGGSAEEVAADLAEAEAGTPDPGLAEGAPGTEEWDEDEEDEEGA